MKTEKIYDSKINKEFEIVIGCNAEENWKRVLEKAPYAKRVHGVKGIFNAHKAAAYVASTDLFYVVDGDAYLTDQWQFNYQPGLFDRDCLYIWSSKNPVNGLKYANGGVKLLPRKNFLSGSTDTPLDVFLGINADVMYVECEGSNGQ